MARQVNVTQTITDDVSFDEFLHNFNSSNHRDLMNVFGLGMDVVLRPEYPIIPTWALMVYLIVVNGSGVLLNLLICIGYLMQKHKIGVFTLVLHMAISDLLTLTLVSIPEMWSHHIGNWTFGRGLCLTYLGSEVFVGTSCIYFLVAMNLHALASANLSKRSTSKDSEAQLLEEVTEMRSSQHSLVCRSETSTPTQSTTVEDKTGRSSVPVMLPVLFIWVLSASLSVPEFPLSTVIDSRSGFSACTFISGYHLTSMRVLLSVFQLLIPFIILSTTSAIITYKLCSPKEKCDSDRALKLALFLCALFLVFSAPRFSLATFYNLWSNDEDEVVGLDRFRSPPLHYPITPVTVPFILSFLHFLAPVIKPFAYVYFLLIKKKTSTTRRRQLHDTETS